MTQHSDDVVASRRVTTFGISPWATLGSWPARHRGIDPHNRRSRDAQQHVTTVRVATNGKSHAEFHDVALWGKRASSLTSPASTSARDASSTSRVGSRAVSGWPPMAARDGPSRSSPTGYRRSPARALRRLRRYNRQGSSPRGLSPSPLGDRKSDPQRFFSVWVARSPTASRRSEPARRSGSPGGLRPFPLTPVLPLRAPSRP
jgi:hypothetical protein